MHGPWGSLKPPEGISEAKTIILLGHLLTSIQWNFPEATWGLLDYDEYKEVLRPKSVGIFGLDSWEVISRPLQTQVSEKVSESPSSQAAPWLWAGPSRPWPGARPYSG